MLVSVLQLIMMVLSFKPVSTDTHIIHTLLLLVTTRNGYLDVTGKFMITFSRISLAIMPIIHKVLKKS